MCCMDANWVYVSLLLYPKHLFSPLTIGMVCKKCMYIFIKTIYLYSNRSYYQHTYIILLLAT